MTQDDEVVFTSLRGRLFGIAYRMLASRADADDVVQEAYVRWHQADREAIRNAEAWLVTATTRLAIDRLRALTAERTRYSGPWLPEPIVSGAPLPDHDLELAQDLSMAFLVLLERLAPEERAAFLLREVYDCGYPDIAAALGKSEAAARQIVHRARERVRGDRARFQATEEARARLVEQFAAAMEAEDEAALLAIFSPDAIWTADGGGRVAASPRPITGAGMIVRLVLGLHRQLTARGAEFRIGSINGEPGLFVRVGGRITGVVAIETDGAQITNVYAVVNPDKLPDGDVLQ